MVTIVLRVPYNSSCSPGCQSWKVDRLRVDKLRVVISLGFFPDCNPAAVDHLGMWPRQPVRFTGEEHCLCL